MGWNNRIFKEYIKYGKDKSGKQITCDGQDGEWSYSVRETYYNEQGEVFAFSDDPRPAFGEDLEGIKWTLERMLEACDKEVLDVNIQLASSSDAIGEIKSSKVDREYTEKEYFDIPFDSYHEIMQEFEHHFAMNFLEDSIEIVYDSEAFLLVSRSMVTTKLRNLGLCYGIGITHTVEKE